MENDIETIGSTKNTNANDMWFQNPLASNEIFFHNTLAQIRNHWHIPSIWKRWQSQKNKSESIGVSFQIPLAAQMGNHWLRPSVRNHWQFTNTIQNPMAHTVWNCWLVVEYTTQPNATWCTVLYVSLACHHWNTRALHEVNMSVLGLWSQRRNNTSNCAKWLIKVYYVLGYMCSVMFWV